MFNLMKINPFVKTSLIGLLFLCPVFSLIHADVVTIVTKRQEEKESTRWTLTKWLEIKERMKLMDVWLAMFSEPSKDKFTPEMFVRFNYHFLENNKPVDNQVLSSKPYPSFSSKLFLNNLVSSAVGVRTLNIDIGIMGYYQKLAKENWGYGGVFRLFGKNSQDTTLDIGLLYARRDVKLSTISEESTLIDFGRFELPELYAGMQIYLAKFFGLEGFYRRYPKPSKSLGSSDMLLRKGAAYGADVFLEIAILRFSAGLTHDQVEYEWGNNQQQNIYKGYHAGVSLYF